MDTFMVIFVFIIILAIAWFAIDHIYNELKEPKQLDYKIPEYLNYNEIWDFLEKYKKHGGVCWFNINNGEYVAYLNMINPALKNAIFNTEVYRVSDLSKVMLHDISVKSIWVWDILECSDDRIFLDILELKRCEGEVLKKELAEKNLKRFSNAISTIKKSAMYLGEDSMYGAEVKAMFANFGSEESINSFVQICWKLGIEPIRGFNSKKEGLWIGNPLMGNIKDLYYKYLENRVNDFTIGGEVICVNASQTDKIKVGEKYIVSSIDYGTHIQVVGVNGTYLFSRFEVVN